MANSKILIVEDDNIVAKDLQKLLTHLGYDVVGVALTGAEAVKKAITKLPDLVLMEVGLKGEMDGIEAAKVLRFQYGIAVVYLSSYADNATLKRASKTEPFGYILKPFEERELHTAIEMALYRRDLERRFKENEAWYGTTLRSIGEAVIATDATGSIKFMNTAAENLTGWKMNEVLGEPLLKVFRTADASAKPFSANPVDQILKNKVTAVLKNHAILVSREGKELPIDESASPIKDELGNIVGAVLVFQDVSERKRVQEALNNSQEYAQNIINSSMDMMIAVDLERRIVEFNKAAETTFGYKKEELIGKHVNILYADPEAGSRINKRVDELGREITEAWNKRKNGEVFQCLLSSAVLWNSRGEKIGYMGTSRDITEMKRADQALRESEERYRALVELSPDPIAVHVDGKVVFVNTAAVQVFAANSADDLIGRPILKLVHPDYRILVKDRIQQMMHEGKRVPTIEEKFIRLDGTSFEAEVAAMSFLWEGKSAIQVVLRDVSERRKAEIVIRGSEAKYRSLVENVLDGVYQTTPDGEILTANPAMARMLGYDSETDLLLLNVERDLYINSEERRQYLKRLNQGERIKNAEFRLRGKDGQVITVLENARMVRSKIGDILYYEGTMTDITELKVVQEALRISEERSRAFIEQSAEAIWCFESPGPMSIHISEERQIRHMMEVGFVTECNDAMARMYKAEHAEQLLGAKLKNLFDPSDPANIEYLRSFIKSNYKLVNAESHETDKDGNLKYFLNNMVGIVEGGYLIRAWGTKRDVTVEKQAEHRLIESEEKYRTLTETVACAIFIFTDEKTLYANPASENISGYSNEELLGMKLWDIVHPEYREMIRVRALNILKGGKLSSLYKLKIITKRGEERWVDVAAGTTSCNGKPAMLATAFDITKQKYDNKEKNQDKNFRYNKSRKQK